jgi:hypothetical protein
MCPEVLSICDWSLAIGIALLGGDDGGPRSEAVGGAKQLRPLGREQSQTIISEVTGGNKLSSRGRGANHRQDER